MIGSHRRTTGFDPDGVAESEADHLTTMGLGLSYLEDVKSLENRCTPWEHALFPPDRPNDQQILDVRGAARDFEQHRHSVFQLFDVIEHQ